MTNVNAARNGPQDDKPAFEGQSGDDSKDAFISQSVEGNTKHNVSACAADDQIERDPDEIAAACAVLLLSLVRRAFRDELGTQGCEDIAQEGILQSLIYMRRAVGHQLPNGKEFDPKNPIALVWFITKRIGAKAVLKKWRHKWIELTFDCEFIEVADLDVADSEASFRRLLGEATVTLTLLQRLVFDTYMRMNEAAILGRRNVYKPLTNAVNNRIPQLIAEGVLPDDFELVTMASVRSAWRLGRDKIADYLEHCGFTG